MWVVALAFAGCTPEMAVVDLRSERHRPPDYVSGAALDTGTVDTGWEEGGEYDPHTGSDTGDPGTGDTGDADPDPDTGDADPDTGDPQDDPTGTQVCYPGEDWNWDACVDVVDKDPAWGSEYGYPEPYGGSAQYTEPARFVDLEAVSSSLQVAPNFVISEFMSSWKGRYGVFQSHAVEHVQNLRDATGGAITVNSGYRSPAYNESVGGVTYSRHMYGDAADMVPSAVSLDTLAAWCYHEGAGYVGMYTSFVHCDWRNDPLDPAFYDLEKGDGAQGPVAATPLPEHRAWIEVGPGGGVLVAPATGFDEGEPHRRWWAWDRGGNLLAREVATRFRPPLGTSRVAVDVGGQIRVEARLVRGHLR